MSIKSQGGGENPKIENSLEISELITQNKSLRKNAKLLFQSSIFLFILSWAVIVVMEVQNFSAGKTFSIIFMTLTFVISGGIIGNNLLHKSSKNITKAIDNAIDWNKIQIVDYSKRLSYIESKIDKSKITDRYLQEIINHLKELNDLIKQSGQI